jgi:hypothetical protein
MFHAAARLVLPYIWGEKSLRRLKLIESIRFDQAHACIWQLNNERLKINELDGTS